MVPSRSRLVAVWIVCALGLAAIVVAARGLRTPGDDADPARQRPGILDLGPLPEPAPEVAGLELPDGRRAVVFFAAPDHEQELCGALSGSDLAADEVVFVVKGTSGSCAPRVAVVAADVAGAAAAFGLPSPRSASVPTGYAVVDSAGRVRYRTLDPVAPALLDEVATMVGAVE